ncbi:hypothetical protein DsansV1_C38g0235241 [Dioscorea sansibarensis]
MEVGPIVVLPDLKSLHSSVSGHFFRKIFVRLPLPAMIVSMVVSLKMPEKKKYIQKKLAQRKNIVRGMLVGPVCRH